MRQKIRFQRSATPREVVAQLLDYASWVRDLSYEQVKSVYEEKNAGKEFEVALAEAFAASAPEEVNDEHRLVVACSELDPSSERIITYLAEEYGVPVNAAFFRYFKDGGHQYLSRT